MLVLDLLGPTRLTYNGVPPAELPGGKNLALLVYLVLERRPHARERLAALLWGDMPAARAQSNLRMALYTLNQILPDVLLSTRSTAGICADLVVQVDVLRLSAVATNLDAPIDELEATVELWRGELLHDLTLNGAALFEDWLGPMRERTRQSLFVVLERFSQACLRRGEPLRALHALQLWLRIEPWSETAHRIMMLAFARSGRYTDALAQYEACCTELQQELAVAPMPETSRLAERIQLARELTQRDNLPAAFAPLVGRETELLELQARLLDPNCRLVTISGLGGMGKTRLALHAATTLKHAFLHGAWFVALESVGDPLGLPASVATALNVPLTPGAAPETLVLQALRERELLLILDGFEALIDEAPRLQQWLADAPGLTICITSRQRLAVRGENVLRLEGLIPAEAATLFHICAQRIHLTAALSIPPDALAALCRLTGGMPLALELAAAWTDRYSVPMIVEQVARDGEALSGAYRDLPANQRSLRAIVAFAWQRLPPKAQTFLARLSVLHGRFDAAQATAIGDGTTETLATLITAALVQQPTDQSYTIHEIIRQYASQQLQAEPTNAAAAHRTHLALVGTFLGEQNALLSGRTTTEAALHRLADMVENMRAAWEYACLLGDWEWLDAAAEPLHKFCEGQGRYAEGEVLFQRAIAAIDVPTTQSRLGVHYAAILLRLGRLPEARAAAEAARPHLPVEMAGFAGNLLGILYAAGGQNEAAMAAYKESLAAYKRNSETRQMVKPLANLGPLLLRLERVEAAIEVLNEGLTLARELGDQRGQCHFLNNLGVAYFQQERYTSANDYFTACADLCRTIANDGVRLVALYNIAEIAMIEGRPHAARESADEAAALAEQFGDRRNQALALRILAMAELQLGQNHDATTHLEAALRLAHATQSPPVILDVLYGWVHLLRMRGDLEPATELLAILGSHPATEKHLLRHVERTAVAMAIPVMSAEDATNRLPLFITRLSSL